MSYDILLVLVKCSNSSKCTGISPFYSCIHVYIFSMSTKNETEKANHVLEVGLRFHSSSKYVVVVFVFVDILSSRFSKRSENCQQCVGSGVKTF